MSDYSKQDIAQIIGLTKRQVQFYVDHQVVTPIESGGLGRGKKQIFSSESVIEFGIISELLDWGVTVSVIRRIIDNWRKIAAVSSLSTLEDLVQKRQERSISDMIDDKDHSQSPCIIICKPNYDVIFRDSSGIDITQINSIWNKSFLVINLFSIASHIDAATSFDPVD